jgi:ATP-dependent Zn protease
VDARFRKYLFPALIAVVLIWIAVQTLGGGSNEKTKLRWSEATALVQSNPSSIASATFRPSKREVDFRLKSGEHKKSVYPLDDSAYALQQLLEKSSVPFDAKSPGSSPWGSILNSLLPFVLLFGFWIFLMRNVQRWGPRQDTGT